MAPALECNVCGKRFTTPQPDKATPEEMSEIINAATGHVAYEAAKMDNPHFVESGAGSALIYEPETGKEGYGKDFDLKQPFVRNK